MENLNEESLKMIDNVKKLLSELGITKYESGFTCERNVEYNFRIPVSVDVKFGSLQIDIRTRFFHAEQERLRGIYLIHAYVEQDYGWGRKTTIEEVRKSIEHFNYHPDTNSQEYIDIQYLKKRREKLYDLLYQYGDSDRELNWSAETDSYKNLESQLKSLETDFQKKYSYIPK